MSWLLRLALVLWVTAAGAQESGPSIEDSTLLILEVRLNGIEKGPVRVLRDATGNFLVSEEELSGWRLCSPHPELPGLHYEAESFRVIALKDGPEVQFDESEQSLAVVLPAECFVPTTVDLSARHVDLTPSSNGAYLNFDFYTDLVSSRSESQRNGSVLLEGGGFGSMGTLLHSVVLAYQPTSAGNSSTNARRLDTAFVRDNPERLTRLTLGDAIGASGLWGSPVRFGGIRYARNFDLRPGFIAQPLPAASGEASLPSTVDVYLNGIFQTHTEVPPGPFTIREVPLVGASGQVEMVVKDLLGRETRVTTTFVSANNLLKPGLVDFSLESGATRLAYGQESFRYGERFAAGTVRYGVSAPLTVEARAELTRQFVTTGLAGAMVIRRMGVQLSGALAISHGDSADGHQETITLRTVHARWLSLSGSLQVNSPQFRQLGGSTSSLPPRYVLASTVSMPLGKRASVTLSRAVNERRSASPIQVNAIAVVTRIGRSGNLVFSNQLASGNTNVHTVAAYFSTSIGQRDSLGMNATHSQTTEQTSSQLAAQYSRARGGELGLDWSAYVNRASESSSGGIGGSWSTPTLTVGMRLDESPGSTRFQGTVSGGVGIIGGRAFASRRITNSFGLIRVGDFPGIDVYVENQLAGRTDARGRLVVPRLVEYTRNRIRIDTTQLPPDALISGSDEVDVTPSFRNGVVLPFQIRRVRSALIEMQLPDGTPVAQDATVRSTGSPEVFYVADRGEVYLTDVVVGKNHLEVEWMDESGMKQRCKADFELPPDAGFQPHIGPITCVP